MCVVLGLLLPRPAAGWGGLEWLDKMSGPGPFTGPSVHARIVCFVKADGGRPEVVPLFGTVRRSQDGREIEMRPCLALTRHEDTVRAYVDATASVLWSARNDLFGERRAEKAAQVRVVTFRPGVMLRAYSWLEAGAGIGWYRFSGDLFDSFALFTLHPVRLRVAPFKGVASGLRFPVELVFFKGPIEGTRFGAPPGFLERNEFQLQVGVTYEF